MGSCSPSLLPIVTYVSAQLLPAHGYNDQLYVQIRSVTGIEKVEPKGGDGAWDSLYVLFPIQEQP